MNFRLLALGGCCWLAAGTLLGSEAPKRRPYRSDAWKTEQGLPQNNVQRLLQTRDGYLWVGTRFGLARFDGVKFTTFSLANIPAMVSDNCVTLAEDPDGHLWIGTDNGLLRLENGAFRRFTVREGLGHNRIMSLCPSHAGGVWIGTGRGITRFQNGRFRNYTNLQETARTAVDLVYEDRESNVWFQVETGLRQLDPVTGKVKAVTSRSEPAGGIIKSIFMDASGKLWFGNSVGLHYLFENKITSFSRERDPQKPDAAFPLYHILETRSGELWVNFQRNEGLYQFAHGKFLKFDPPPEVGGDYVNCMIEDREENLWLGTSVGGLVRIQHRPVVSYSGLDGLPGEDSWSVCESQDGGIWASSGDGFCRIGAGPVTAYLIPGYPSGKVKTLYEDKSGQLWLGKEAGIGLNASLHRFKDGKIEDFSTNAGINSRYIRSLYEDRAGHLWIGTDQGMNRYRDGQFTRYTVKDGLGVNDVRAFLEDRSGRLWIGTYGGGLNWVQDGRFSAITRKEGLTSDFVWVLHEDHEGTLWIGTDNGLNRRKNGKLFRFTKKDGLFDNLINHLMEDDLGNFWISCNRGIYRVRRDDLNEFAEGRLGTIRYVAYSEADGMVTSETNGEVQPAGWKARDGRLWFPTAQGVVVIDPKAMKDNLVPPPVVIEVMKVDSEKSFLGGSKQETEGGLESAATSPFPAQARPRVKNAEVQLGPGEGRVIEFQYTGNSLVAPEKVLFKYKLEGYDTNWVDAGSRRVAYYTNLRAGHYRFSAIACNNHGTWNTQGDSMSFYIAPHFYQTYPFYTACFLGLMLSGYGIHRRRVSVLTTIHGLERQHGLELERTRIAKDMHDGLGASLTLISLQSELARRDAGQAEAAQAHLEKITLATREMLRSLDEIVWATTPNHDTLESLLVYLCKFAQEYLRPADIRCRLDIPEALPQDLISAETRHHVLLAAKEALTNIVRHAAPSEVWVRAQLSPTVLQIQIEDDGRGFDSASTSLLSTPAREGRARPAGNGLPNLKHRLEAIGGTFVLETRPGGGTKIKMTIPRLPVQTSPNVTRRNPLPGAAPPHRP